MKFALLQVNSKILRQDCSSPPPTPHKLLTPLFPDITKVVHYIHARGA